MDVVRNNGPSLSVPSVPLPTQASKDNPRKRRVATELAGTNKRVKIVTTSLPLDGIMQPNKRKTLEQTLNTDDQCAIPPHKKVCLEHDDKGRKRKRVCGDDSGDGELVQPTLSVRDEQQRKIAPPNNEAQSNVDGENTTTKLDSNFNDFNWWKLSLPPLDDYDDGMGD